MKRTAWPFVCALWAPAFWQCAFAVTPQAPTLLRSRGRAGNAQVMAGLQQPPPPSGNPVVALYRKWTMEYQKDAEEAEKAAAMYADMTEKAADSKGLLDQTHAVARQDLNRIGVGTWAHATWQVEQMLRDPAPGQAAAAGAAAAAPYNKAYDEYTASKNSYDAAAQAYGLRVGMDEGLSKKLATYSNQYRLEGNQLMADEYENQAKLLMQQAEKFKGISRDYHGMASKIFAVLPVIQGMGGTAANFAGWQKNPGNHFGAEQVFPFTVMPPVEFTQTGMVQEEKGQ